ncbi:MAG TPA: ABC transporter permease subunit [Candidatus Polarisedimenticolaceae bacterium]|nr:ABC transporter permease subunit [Candidatus Polarisedimenticolaceae bacterium]
MTTMILDRMADSWRLLWLSAKTVGGRRFYLWPPLPLLWPAWQWFRSFMGWREEGPFQPPDAQVGLIAFPLVVLAIMLGVRVIAGEIDRRTLEIAYTVPGGTHRIWLYKLAAGLGILLTAEALLAGAAFAITDYPPMALYGALQAALFYMVLSAALAAAFKSEAAGALVTIVILVINFPMQESALRISPFWNPEALPGSTDPRDLLAWTTQNRIGFALAIAAIAALAFGRAESREKLLGG